MGESSKSYEEKQRGYEENMREGELRRVSGKERKPRKAAVQEPKLYGAVAQERELRGTRAREKDPEDTGILEGRNAVLEAFRAGREMERLYVLDGCQDGPVRSILREAKKRDTLVTFVPRERLDQMSRKGKHQGVVAYAAAYAYARVEDLLGLAKKRGESPFLILLDGIEDPHNLGAIIRTANLAGAHGIVIPKRRAVGLTATVAKASAGAINYTPVAKVTNLCQTIKELQKQGIWFVCADMGGDVMYEQKLDGPIGLVIGGEGKGVTRLVKETCDFCASIPMRGEIDSLNASVATGILAYEIVRQRMASE